MLLATFLDCALLSRLKLGGHFSRNLPNGPKQPKLTRTGVSRSSRTCVTISFTGWCRRYFRTQIRPRCRTSASTIWSRTLRRWRRTCTRWPRAALSTTTCWPRRSARYRRSWKRSSSSAKSSTSSSCSRCSKMASSASLIRRPCSTSSSSACHSCNSRTYFYYWRLCRL